MQTLIVYDSQFGNTEKIALTIGEAIGEGAKVLHAKEADAETLRSYDLLIIGGPTQGGRATKPVQELLKKIGRNSLKDVKTAAFDTRLATKWVSRFGYAAGRIGKEITSKGATMVAPPEPFYVTGDKVPAIIEGELERAAAWAKEISRREA